MNNVKKNRFDQYLSDIYLCTIFSLLPLVVNNGFFNISQTKSLCFLSLTVIFVFVWLIYKIADICINKAIDFKILFLDFSVAFFAIVNIFSAIFSKYDKDVWIGKNSRLQGALVVILYSVLYFIISNSMSEKISFASFLTLTFSLVSGIAVLNSIGIDMFGFFERLMESDKGKFISTIGNINFFSAYVALCFPFVICLYCSSDEKIQKLHYLAALVLGTLAAVLTSSESFVVGFVGFMCIYPLFVLKNKKTLSNFAISAIIIIVTAFLFKCILTVTQLSNYKPADLLNIVLHPIIALALIMICVAIYFVSEYKSNFLNIIQKIYIALLYTALVVFAVLFIWANCGSLGTLDKYFKITDEWGNQRGMIYKKCFELLKGFSFKEWLIGIGPETLQNEFKLQGGGILDQAHSEYLQYLLTTGILGLASYLGIILSLFVVVIRKLRENSVAIALSMGLFAYLIQAMFNIAQSFTTPFVYLFIAIISGYCKNLKRGENSFGKKNKIKS